MSITEPTTMDEIFEYLGVTTLERALAGGTVIVHCTDHGHEQYGRIAAGVLRDPEAEEVTKLGELMAVQLFAVLTDEGDVTCDEEGRTWVRFPWNGNRLTEVTPKLIQHWQWLYAIATSPGVPGRFMSTLPAPTRERIEAEIAERAATAAAFETLVAPLARVSDQEDEL